MINDKVETKTLEGRFRWVGLSERYFLKGIIFSEETNARVVIKRKGDYNLLLSIYYPEIELKKGEVTKKSFKIYTGPKSKDSLSSFNARLDDAIDFGILAPICHILIFIMNLFYSFIPNWGIAIILLTFVIKLALFPLTKKSYESMAGLSKLKPQMEKLKTKFKDDKQKQQEEMLKLYRKEGVNPFGGCLPTLLQFPIWIALYWALGADVNLYQAPFIPHWIDDLSTADPYYVMPVLLGIATFLQQKLTPQASMDEMQAKMMLFMMPAFMTFIMLMLPSGLNLYLIVNFVVTIIQQKMINSKINKPINVTKKVRTA